MYLPNKKLSGAANEIAASTPPKFSASTQATGSALLTIALYIAILTPKRSILGIKQAFSTDVTV